MKTATPVELAVLNLLKPALPECTFEVGFRPVLFVGDKLSKGFRVEELPALQIEEGLNPERSRAMTTGEVRHLIPVSVMLVMTDLDASKMRSDMLKLQRKIHEAINRGRRSGVLGTNMWVMGDVTASNSIVTEERFFGLAQTQFEITRVVLNA